MTTTVFFLFRNPLQEASPFSVPRPTGAPQYPGGREPEPGQSSIGATVREGWRRWRSRVALSELDAHILKDIGVTPAEAEHEANKPFWRA
jgi:uncharacterized protein YjiS (DUF1127 family)